MAPINISGENVTIHNLVNKFNDVNDKKHLRMRGENHNLYVHDSSKNSNLLHGLMGERAGKRANAYEAIKGHLESEYGEDAVNILVQICNKKHHFRKDKVDKSISVSQLKQLEARLSTEMGIMPSGERLIFADIGNSIFGKDMSIKELGELIDQLNKESSQMAKSVKDDLGLDRIVANKIDILTQKAIELSSDTRPKIERLNANELSSLIKESQVLNRHTLPTMTKNEAKRLGGELISRYLGKIDDNSLEAKGLKELTDLLKELDSMNSFPLSADAKKQLRVKVGEVRNKLQGKLNAVSLDSILNRNNDDIKPSSAGAGGVIFMNASKDSNEIDLVVKPDPQIMQDVAVRMSKAIGMLSNSWPDCPVTVPCCTQLDFSDNRDEVIQKFTDIINKKLKNPEDKIKMTNQIKYLKNSIKNNPNGGADKLMLMEKLNGKDLNKIDTERKAELLKTPDFALRFGKSAPLATLLGFNDHSTLLGNLNMSNLFLTPGNEIVFMDNAATMIGSDRIGFTSNVIIEKMKEIKNLAAPNREFEKDAEASIKKDDISALAGSGPDRFISSILATGFPDAFFPEKEELESANLTENNKKILYLNYLKGSLQGIQEIRKHESDIQNTINDQEIKIGDGDPKLFNELGDLFKDFDFGLSIAKIEKAIASLG